MLSTLIYFTVAYCACGALACTLVSLSVTLKNETHEVNTGAPAFIFWTTLGWPLLAVVFVGAVLSEIGRCAGEALRESRESWERRREAKRRPVIGLTGFAQSGKDEAFKALESEGFTRVSFADALRESLYALNPILLDEDLKSERLKHLVDTLGWDEAKQHPEVRRLLQTLGTEAGRYVHGPECWVDIVRRKIAAIKGPVVLTDVRFENELDLVRELGGELWLIVRPGVGPVNDHASEGRLHGRADRTLVNGTTLEAWREIVRKVAKSLQEKT